MLLDVMAKSLVCYTESYCMANLLLHSSWAWVNSWVLPKVSSPKHLSRCTGKVDWIDVCVLPLNGLASHPGCILTLHPVFLGYALDPPWLRKSGYWEWIREWISKYQTCTWIKWQGGGGSMVNALCYWLEGCHSNPSTAALSMLGLWASNWTP